jgi:hypothetical protein
MRRSENQAKAQTDIPDAIAGLASVDAVSSAAPNLQFVAAFDGAGLRTSRGCAKERGKEDGCERSSHGKLSFEWAESGHRISGAEEDIENPRERRLSSSSFQVAADNLNDIVGGFFRRFGIARHVIADMVFHQFGHQAVDGAASGGEALECVGARLIFMECAKNAFELPDDFLGAVDQIQLFSRSMRHLSCIP